jgi:hypothetical protein
MRTEKDAEIVGWVGRVGAAGAEDVMGRFGMGRSWAYARLGSLVSGGLLEQRVVLYRKAGLYVATVEGLRWSGLRRLGVYKVSPGNFEHSQQVARVAVALNWGFPGWEILSEREIRVEESDHGGLLASARVGELPGGGAALHRPDLALVSKDGRVLAVEVELSVKASHRLTGICRGWARARHVSHVYYLAAPAAARAVSRAVKETRAEDRVTVLALQDVAGLAGIELGEVNRVGA